MRSGGMEAVGKHFPGHGTVAGDSHHVMPFDKREFSEIEALDLVPFRRVIATHLAGIMMAHVIYEAGSTNWQPATRVTGSKPCCAGNWVSTGSVFSDDLNMAGAETEGGFAGRAQRALQAGCDVLLVCNNAEGADEVLESLGSYSNPYDPVADGPSPRRKKLRRSFCQFALAVGLPPSSIVFTIAVDLSDGGDLFE